jgi:enoyl-CoA hydratase/carnithine racemase
VGCGALGTVRRMSASAEQPVVVTRPIDGVVQLTLNRPEKLNALTVEMVAQLHEALDAVAVERDCRVVVLTGAGRGFCAGLDLKGYGVAPHAEGLGRTQAGMAVQKHIASLIPHLRSLPQPVIAAVNGPAAGGGFALVLGSDIRLAARTARFNAAFIRIGLSACDIGTSWLLPRLVGAARAHELMLTGRIFDAAEAARIGLVLDAVDDDVLLETAYAKAGEIMANAPMGVAMTKEGMWSALEIPGMQAAIDLENRQQIMISATADHGEALSAFLERRPPHYEHR